MNPPSKRATPAWKATTRYTATARRPSSAGMRSSEPDVVADVAAMSSPLAAMVREGYGAAGCHGCTRARPGESGPTDPTVYRAAQ